MWMIDVLFQTVLTVCVALGAACAITAVVANGRCENV